MKSDQDQFHVSEILEIMQLGGHIRRSVLVSTAPQKGASIIIIFNGSALKPNDYACSKLV